MIGDHDLKVAKLYNMLPADAGETSEGRTAANNATVRTVYIIGPDKQIKAMLIYPMSTGRNFDEVLRLLDCIQLTAKHSVATPVNWKQGEDCIIVPSLNDEAAQGEIPGRLEDGEALPSHGAAAGRRAAAGRLIVSADNRARQHPVLQRIIEMDRPILLEDRRCGEGDIGRGAVGCRWRHQYRLHPTAGDALAAWSKVTQPIRQRASWVAPL